jgi:hypothetical protein
LNNGGEVTRYARRHLGTGLMGGKLGTIFASAGYDNGDVPFFDISRDGKRFLVERLWQQVSQSVAVVPNFAEGLKK